MRKHKNLQVASGKSCVIILYAVWPTQLILPTTYLPYHVECLGILLSAQASDGAPGSKPKLLLYGVPKAN